MDTRKTIRFDRDSFSALSSLAKEMGISFSSLVRILSMLKATEINQSDISASNFVGLNNDDRDLLHRILVLYSRSSTNINQSTRALNELKNLSWLDLNREELIKKLSSIDSNLTEVNDNFKYYKNILDKLIQVVRNKEMK